MPPVSLLPVFAVHIELLRQLLVVQCELLLTLYTHSLPNWTSGGDSMAAFIHVLVILVASRKPVFI